MNRKLSTQRLDMGNALLLTVMMVVVMVVVCPCQSVSFLHLQQPVLAVFSKLLKNIDITGPLSNLNPYQGYLRLKSLN